MEKENSWMNLDWWKNALFAKILIWVLDSFLLNNNDNFKTLIFLQQEITGKRWRRKWILTWIVFLTHHSTTQTWWFLVNYSTSKWYLRLIFSKIIFCWRTHIFHMRIWYLHSLIHFYELKPLLADDIVYILR